MKTSRLALLILSAALSPLDAAQSVVRNGGFEQGLAAPWGTGQYAEGRTAWWNSGGCDSDASVDRVERRSGQASLHLRNRSRRSPHVFGTTNQAVAIVPGQRYRVELWAKGRGLASNGAVSVVVDEAWGVRPILLRAGSRDWTRYTGDFTPASSMAQVRILMEDAGEAWIDDLSITPVEVPRELEELGDLVTGLGKPVRSVVGREGAEMPIEPGVRLVVEQGTFSKATSLEVSTYDVALSSIDPRIESARAYAVGANHTGVLARPVVLDLGVPRNGATVVERVGGSWRRVPLLPGENARVGIDSFSFHFFVEILYPRAVAGASAVLRGVESVAVKRPWVSKARASEAAIRTREFARSAGPGARAFYGIGEKATKSLDEMRAELLDVVARNREGVRRRPWDSPWTSADLVEYLHDNSLPSRKGGYYWDKVKETQPLIRQALVSEPDRVTPGRLLDISIRANGGDVRLGVLAAGNFLKENTMAGRDYPRSEPGPDGNMRIVDVPERIAEVARKLVTWRTTDLAPAGYYDKMGPLYHLFAAMTAGAWGGSHLSLVAVGGENFLRSTGWVNDYPDPEKGEADILGGEIADLINVTFPLHPWEDPKVVEPERPVRPAPTVPSVPVIVRGTGTWSVRTATTSGEGPISLAIDLGKGTISGEISGPVTTLFEGQRSTVSPVGTISGTYTGSSTAGSFRGKATIDPKRAGGAWLPAPLEISGELAGGRVTGTAAPGVSETAVAMTKAAEEMGDINASRSGATRPRRRTEAEIRRDLGEKMRAEGRQFSFVVGPR